MDLFTKVHEFYVKNFANVIYTSKLKRGVHVSLATFIPVLVIKCLSPTLIRSIYLVLVLVALSDTLQIAEKTVSKSWYRLLNYNLSLKWLYEFLTFESAISDLNYLPPIQKSVISVTRQKYFTTIFWYLESFSFSFDFPEYSPLLNLRL